MQQALSARWAAVQQGMRSLRNPHLEGVLGARGVVSGREAGHLAAGLAGLYTEWARPGAEAEQPRVQQCVSTPAHMGRVYPGRQTTLGPVSRNGFLGVSLTKTLQEMSNISFGRV